MSHSNARPVFAAVVRAGTGNRPLARHEDASLEAMAEAIAGLLGVPRADAAVPGTRAYFVPDDTLDAAQAAALGVHDEYDLFGGVVPHRFAATKLVSHPLVGADAAAPDGWVHALAEAIDGAVLPGYAVFSEADARRAADRLLPLGPLRLKLARGLGGRGQARVADLDELDEALAALPADELRLHGATLEQELADSRTWSIGVARCGALAITYAGVQRTTRDRHGNAVYGGSDLDVVRGGFDALLQLPLPPDAHRAVSRAQHYDAAMSANFPGFFASRRNYDVVAGQDAQGRDACGVLEQSWRIGGASPAELAAMRAFADDPSRVHVRASCREAHGVHTPPPGAIVGFRGDDPSLGPLCKYAWVH